MEVVAISKLPCVFGKNQKPSFPRKWEPSDSRKRSESLDSGFRFRKTGSGPGMTSPKLCANLSIRSEAEQCGTQCDPAGDERDTAGRRDRARPARRAQRQRVQAAAEQHHAEREERGGEP